jgi:hypothetical protein
MSDSPKSPTANPGLQTMDSMAVNYDPEDLESDVTPETGAPRSLEEAFDDLSPEKKQDLLRQLHKERETNPGNLNEEQIKLLEREQHRIDQEWEEEEKPLRGTPGKAPVDQDPTTKPQVGGDDEPVSEEEKGDPEFEKREKLLNEAMECKNKGNELFKGIKGDDDFERLKQAREMYYSASKLLISRREEYK